MNLNFGLEARATCPPPMNNDPDFHPLAAAWLDGTATPPEQKLLGEILHGPDTMPEYAALCRTETLLAQSGSTAADRRAALGRMPGGKPWSRRVTGWWKHPAARFAAAAAFVVLCAWWLWPDTQTDKAPRAKRSLIPRMESHSASAQPAEDELRVADQPPPEAGLETKLRQRYVGDFAAAGPLPEAAAKLIAAIGADIHMTTDVRDPGDAPVLLKPATALPAWTLLKLMAVQSGTEMRLVGDTVVFRAARKPLSRTDKIARTSELSPLLHLFNLSLTTGDREVFPGLLPAAQATLGASLGFTIVALEKPVTYSGSSRDVLLLELALESITSPAVNAAVAMKLLQLPADAGTKTEGRPEFSGLFTDSQFQIMMRSLQQSRGVRTMTYPSVLSRPHQTVQLNTDAANSEGLYAEVTVVPAGGLDCYLACDFVWTEADPANPGSVTNQSLSTTILIPGGSTAGFAGFKQTDGSEMVIYVSAMLVNAAGEPLNGPLKSPAADAPPPVDITDQPTTPPALRKLPSGIPVPDKPGMVQSPYAPEKGFIDVTGFKRGTRVECPYTGKHFRVP